MHARLVLPSGEEVPCQGERHTHAGWKCPSPEVCMVLTTMHDPVLYGVGSILPSQHLTIRVTEVHDRLVLPSGAKTPCQGGIHTQPEGGKCPSSWNSKREVSFLRRPVGKCPSSGVQERSVLPLKLQEYASYYRDDHAYSVTSTPALVATLAIASSQQVFPDTRPISLPPSSASHPSNSHDRQRCSSSMSCVGDRSLTVKVRRMF